MMCLQIPSWPSPTDSVALTDADNLTGRFGRP